MRKAILITLLIFGAFKSNSQNFLSKEAIHFIRQVITDKRDIFLKDSINNYQIEKIESSVKEDTLYKQVITNGIVKNDSIILSKEERKYLDSCIKSFHSFKWSAINTAVLAFPNLKLIESNTFLSRTDRYGKYIYTICKPIFLRNNSICFFYYDYTCGMMCGFGQLSIYIKEKSNWVLWEVLYRWVS